MAIVLPYTFVPGEPAAAAKVDANFQALAAAIEGVSAAAAGTDVYQAGVLSSTDWVPSARAINEGTGVIEVTYPSSAAWLPGPVSGLVRTFTPGATTKGLKPPVLPGPGGYVRVGEEITASGGEAVVSVVSGTEQASEALAIANPPPVSAGKVRVRDIVVVNIAGKYTVVAGRDRRPWARGFYAQQKRTAGSLTLGAVALLDSTNLSLRVECSGEPLVITLASFAQIQEGAAGLGIRMDGAALDGTKDGEIIAFNSAVAGQQTSFPFTMQYRYVPAAGSHLFQPTGVKISAAGATILASANSPLVFSVDEDVRPSANNGTA